MRLPKILREATTVTETMILSEAANYPRGKLGKIFAAKVKQLRKEYAKKD